MEQPIYCGPLEIPPKEPMRSIDGYARLQAFKLELWDDNKSCEMNIQPRRTIDINRDTKLKLKDETDIIVYNMEEGTIEEYIFRTKTSGETIKWHSAIKKTIKEHLQWNHVAISSPMPLAIPGNPKNFFVRQSRQRSLYEQVPIITENIENRQQQQNRPTVHDIFAIPNSVNTSPTLGDFRNRTYSSGRSSSQSSSTLSGESINSVNSISITSTVTTSSSKKGSHWPFGGSGK